MKQRLVFMSVGRVMARFVVMLMMMLMTLLLLFAD
jgi:hypothetical protein